MTDEWALLDGVSEDGATLQATLRVPLGSPWVDGHFPGRPMLPGAALLDALLAALEAVGQTPRGRIELSRVRFRQEVRPGEALELTLRRDRHPWAFQFARDGELVCRGALTAPESATLLVDVTSRAAVAEALLAAARGGVRVLLPYDTSDEVLAEAEAEVPGVRRLSTWLEARRSDALTQDLATLLGPAPSGGPAWRSPLVGLFTGGSTGARRLFWRSPAALFDEARALGTTLDVGHGDTILATVPAHHIYGLLTTVLLPWVSGARVVTDNALLPAEIAEAAERHLATWLVSAPLHLAALAAAGRAAPPRVLSSGGALPSDVAVALRKRSGARVVELFGSTETGGIGWRDSDGPFSPLPGVAVRVSAGRLAVRSPYLSSELPLDDEHFVTADGAELVTPPGGPAPVAFRLLGRADRIVKLGDRRVDLAEVEERLASLSGVSEALCLSEPAPGRAHPRLVALVASALDAATLRRAAAEVLEPWRRPRILIPVVALPRTPLGKPDWAAARALARAATSEAASTAAAGGEAASSPQLTPPEGAHG